MKYEGMGAIRKFFHTHYWALPNGDEPLHCEECGFQPSCQYHGKKLYMHGWDNLIDCYECQKQSRNKGR